MALITTLVPDVRADIPSIPSFVAQRYLIRAARIFCEETRAWRVDFLLSTTATIPTVLLTSQLPANTELVDVISLKLAAGGNPVDPKTYAWMDENLSQWRTDTGLNANYYVLDGLNTIRLVPLPSVTTASQYDIRVAVKPTRAATELDNVLLNKFDEALIHGALGMLYALPGKSWTDTGLSAYHTREFMDAIPGARALAADEFQTGVARKVKYGGL